MENETKNNENMITFLKSTEIYITQDYPYGFRLRTEKRDWIDFDAINALEDPNYNPFKVTHYTTYANGLQPINN